MPFKIKLIKQFQRSVKSLKEQMQTADRLLEQGEANNKLKLKKTKQKKRITQNNYNFYQATIRRIPGQTIHVVNFYNLVGLNQSSMRNNQWEESYIQTLFYVKNVKKIEMRKQCLILHLCDSPLQFPPLTYAIDRFRSFGDMKFFHFSNIMSEVGTMLKAIQKLSLQQDQEENNQFLQKYIESMNSRMHISRVSNNKLVISKSLLKVLQYDAEEFAIQTLKFKAPMHELISSNKYFEVMAKFFENMRNLLNFLADKITLQIFLENSIFSFTDHFCTKSNKQIYGKVRAGMPNPLVSFFQLEQIIKKSDYIPKDTSFRSYHQAEIEAQHDYKRSIEVKTVRCLIKVPQNLLPQNSQIVTQCVAKISKRSS